jgi:glycosyltransferase involved in cell wall biosynthesis
MGEQGQDLFPPSEPLTARQRLRQWLVKGHGRLIARPLYHWLVAWELAAERILDNRRPAQETADPPLLEQVTALVKTFERPLILTRLVESIHRLYPTLLILVVDDSREPTYLENVQTLALPFNSGLSAGRRAGLAHLTTPYFFLLDDDFILYRHTRLLEALALMEQHPQIDIMGGEVVYLPFYRTIDYRHAPLLPTTAAPTFPAGSFIGRLPVYDKVANFFIGRTDRIRLVNWDPQLKLLEHADFFTRARGILTTVYNPHLKCLHAKTPFDHHYMRHRQNLMLEAAIIAHRYAKQTRHPSD